MSFDEGKTWEEAFQLQPGFAAYSSMQRLANGDLAIIFEDGSLGNQDKMDCYAINYVVLSQELIAARAQQLHPEDPDGVSGLGRDADNQAETLTYYDLFGRNIASPQKGQIYIRGVKVVLF